MLNRKDKASFNLMFERKYIAFLFILILLPLISSFLTKKERENDCLIGDIYAQERQYLFNRNLVYSKTNFKYQQEQFNVNLQIRKGYLHYLSSNGSIPLTNEQINKLYSVVPQGKRKFRENDTIPQAAASTLSELFTNLLNDDSTLVSCHTSYVG